jgi:hypothetical protein
MARFECAWEPPHVVEIQGVAGTEPCLSELRQILNPESLSYIPGFGSIAHTGNEHTGYAYNVKLEVQGTEVSILVDPHSILCTCSHGLCEVSNQKSLLRRYTEIYDSMFFGSSTKFGSSSSTNLRQVGMYTLTDFESMPEILPIIFAG